MTTVAQGGIILDSRTYPVELVGKPEQLVDTEGRKLPPEFVALLNRGLLGTRTESWSKTDADGYTQNVIVEIEKPINGGEQVIMSYPLLAGMLTDLGWALPSDYQI